MPHSKKHRASKKRRVTKGGFYAFDGALAPGAPSWGRGSEMGDFAVSRLGNNSIGAGGRRRSKKRGGAKKPLPIDIPDAPSMDAGRRRKTKKRRMRGGGKYGAVAASFTGTGERGMANYVSTNTKFPPFGGPEGGAFNNAGAGPGSGFGSFVRM